MGRCFRQLQRDDRLKIYAWLQVKVPVAEIARRLNVSRQTIYREIKRGLCLKRESDWTEHYVYDPDVAERHYQEHCRVRGSKLKAGNDLALKKEVGKRLREGFSPEAALALIRNEGKEFGITISINTIYSYIKIGLFPGITMEDLPERKKAGKKHKNKRVKVQKRAQPGDSISLRPKKIESREEFGHWEMDTVVGARGESGHSLLVLTERKSRKEILVILKRKTKEEVVKALNRLERKIGEKTFRKLFKSITMDNGSEFYDVAGIERSRRGKKPRTKTYYCHPYSSWERGTNENNNRFVRRRIPKGVNFDYMSRKEIQEIEDWMNGYPRPMFGYASANDIFAYEFEKLMAS